MKIDAQLLLADNQTLSGDAVSDNVIDFQQARDIGVGENLYIGVAVTAAATGTLSVDVETDDNEGFASATKTKVGALVFPAAAPAGSLLFYRISPGDINERYMRLDFNGLTAGDVKAFIVKDINAVTNYPIGYSIS